MTNKPYKTGDVVHVRLDEESAKGLNEGVDVVCLDLDTSLIAHHPAKPEVRWVNVYSGGFLGDAKRKLDLSYGRTCVLRLEWPDGDMSKPLLSDNVTVEGV